MCVYTHVCLFQEGGGDSSDKLPHLDRFKRSERSSGEAFISETEKKRQNQDGVSVKKDEKAGEGEERGLKGGKNEIKNKRDNPRGCLPWSC